MTKCFGHKFFIFCTVKQSLLFSVFEYRAFINLNMQKHLKIFPYEAQKFSTENSLRVWGQLGLGFTFLTE